MNVNTVRPTEEITKELMLRNSEDRSKQNSEIPSSENEINSREENESES